ncbi:hypothetical protein ACTG9Q_05825 [Actinokineospora sp. 24-640]
MTSSERRDWRARHPASSARDRVEHGDRVRCLGINAGFVLD